MSPTRLPGAEYRNVERAAGAMGETYRGPIVDEASLAQHVLDVLRAASARLDAKALGAVVVLVVGTLAWDRVHFTGPAGEWPFAPDLPGEFWLSVLVVEILLAVPLVFCVLVADAAVDRGARTALAYPLAVVISMALGSWLQYEVRQRTGLRVWADVPGRDHAVALAQPLLVFLEASLRNALVVAVYVNRRTTLQAQRRMREAELARASAQRRTYESRLQALQARVEPQFLFNTLAQVRRLFATDPERGSAMLDDLIGYLRAALPHLRESSSTVGQELALAQAWLRILRARGTEGPAMSLQADEAVRAAAMPPMVLLPLIDCALGRGDAQARPIQVTTRAADGRLHVRVRHPDAPRAPATDEEGWQVIGQRLRALYGERAALTIDWREGYGTQADLTIPHELTDRGHR